MHERTNEVPDAASWSAALRRHEVPTVLLAIAGILLIDPWPYEDPVPPAAATPAWATDPSPIRAPALRPETTVGAFRYRCDECHSLFTSPVETDRALTQHRQIRMEHGINSRCFNCHLRGDRNAFADYRGERIPYDQPQMLCAKCHGPVYRDWTHGVHGRTNGYWDPARGPARRLRCIECHDPHAPAFAAMKPAPGPHTLRMGVPRSGPHEESETPNPLAIYRQASPVEEKTSLPPGTWESH